jgi:hypothetical protein
MQFHKVSVPISVPVTKKKKFYLNLNQYRNAHHFTLSRAKVNFHEIVAPIIKHLPRYDTVTFIYTLFTGSEQLVDTPNVCSIVDKFFSDVMVTCQKLEDDNRKIVLGSIYLYGGVDRFNPRCEVTMIPGAITFGPAEEEPMQITINQAEIEEAIRDFVTKKLTVNAGQRIDIDLKATRGDEGYTAIIDIVDAEPVTSTGIAQVAAEVKAERTPAAPAPKAERPKAVTKAAAPKAAEPVAEEAAPVAEAPAAAEEEAPFDGGTPVAEAPAAESAQEEPAKPRPSLFGGLGAPQNS